MMRRILTVFFFVCVVFPAYGAAGKKSASVKSTVKKDISALPEPEAEPPLRAEKYRFEPGERFTYQIDYKGLPVGTSYLTLHGETVCEGQNVWHITFTTSMPMVKDEEVLYADPKTFLPVCVKRTIHKVGNFPEKIDEIYDQKNYSVSVHKRGKIRSKKFTIQRDAPIYNAILLAYYYRTLPELEKSPDLAVTLPTLDFTIQYRGKELLKTPLGQIPAYVFVSTPPKFRLWISADGKRIPLKIENPGTLGYSMELRNIDYLSEKTADSPAQ